MAVTGLVSLLAMLSFALPVFQTRAYVTPGSASQTKPKPASVRELFEANCARCHGADGRSQTPLGETYKSPDLTDGEWWKKNADITSTRSLIGIVTNGRGGMPGFGKKLKSAEIKSLVNYVRKFRK